MKYQSMIALAATGAVITPPSGLILPRSLQRGRASPLIKADASDPKALFEELRRSVEALRTDIPDAASIQAIVDPLIAAKEEAINETINNLEEALEKINKQVSASLTAPVIGDLPANPEYVTNFKSHMRIGDNVAPEVRNAMSIGTAADGGYLAPVEWDRSITAALVEDSPIRENSQVITISGQGFSRLYSTGQPGSGWVGETAARPQTSTPQFSTLAFNTGELYANPAITQIALDDAAIDLEAWLRDEVRAEFGRQENIAFLSGDGVNKPFGLLTYVTGAANAAKHPFGAIEMLTTAGNLATGVVGDDVLSLMDELEAERDGNAKFYMNRRSQTKLRKLKDADGNYIWQPSMQAGAPATLFGTPIVHLNGMASSGANAIVMLYGDMRATYLVVDRIGIRVLRDPYTNKPFVMFYTTKRVGGGVQNPEYMKALRLAAA